MTHAPRTTHTPARSMLAMAVLSAVVVFRGAQMAIHHPDAIFTLKMWPDSAADLVIAFPIITLRFELTKMLHFTQRACIF